MVHAVKKGNLLNYLLFQTEILKANKTMLKVTVNIYGS